MILPSLLEISQYLIVFIDCFLLVKIEKDKLLIVQDEILEDVSIEDVASELPETQPRYVIYSYRHERSDGRVSFPLIFIYYSPNGIFFFLQKEKNSNL